MKDSIVKFVYSYPYDRAIANLTGRKWTEDYLKSTPKYIKSLREEWKKLEEKIFTEMAEVTGLKWGMKEIKCYVNNYGPSFSNPLTIAIREREIKDIIDLLVHEAIHVFFVSNNLKRLGVGKQFEDEDLSTRAHIYLHALHKHLYLKFFGEERLKKDIAFSEKIKGKKPCYARAWEIVEQEGHEKLIKQIKDAAKKK